MFGWIVLLTLTLICAGCGSQADVEIAADTDRDSQVDFQKDRMGKNSWTPERGALFLNNNDSDLDAQTPDHADDVVNGAADPPFFRSRTLSHVGRRSSLRHECPERRPLHSLVADQVGKIL